MQLQFTGPKDIVSAAGSGAQLYSTLQSSFERCEGSSSSKSPYYLSEPNRPTQTARRFETPSSAGDLQLQPRK